MFGLKNVVALFIYLFSCFDKRFLLHLNYSKPSTGWVGILVWFSSWNQERRKPRGVSCANCVCG